MIPRVPLAPQGPEFSRLVYGTWRVLDDAASATSESLRQRFHACLDLGITTIDTAEIYGLYRVEEFIGETLKRDPGLRNRLQIVSKAGIYVVMAMALLTSAFIFCQRAVFFAPMDEIRVPRSNTGSAMALGSFIGYLPGAFMGIVYGTQLDAHPGVEGYRIVFGIMLGLACTGFIVSSLLVRAIRKKQAAEKQTANV